MNKRQTLRVAKSPKTRPSLATIEIDAKERHMYDLAATVTPRQIVELMKRLDAQDNDDAPDGYYIRTQLVRSVLGLCEARRDGTFLGVPPVV